MSDVEVHSDLLSSTSGHVTDTGGAGRPVVLIHGWPLSGESWSAQIPVLRAAGYRVIAYDRRRFGRSDKPERGYDFDTLTEDLHGLITAVDLDDVSGPSRTRTPFRSSVSG